MENSLDKLDKEKTDPQNRQDESFKIISIVNRNQLVTSSAKVMIKFPPQNDDYDDDHDDDRVYENKRNENKNEEVSSTDNNDGFIAGDASADSPVYTNDTPKNDLLFYGVVKDNNYKPLEGAAVMVFACYKGGIEKPLGYTFTDNEGTYILNLPEPADYNSLEGFKVRAGKGGRPTERKGRPANYGERPNTKSLNRGFFDFLKLVSNNPNKTISELMKSL